MNLIGKEILFVVFLKGENFFKFFPASQILLSGKYIEIQN